MARRTVAKNGVCEHSTAIRLVSTCYLLLLPSLSFARPTSDHEGEVGTLGTKNRDQNYIFGYVADSFLASSWLGIGVSLSFLLIFVSMLALCGAGGCCGKIKWFGRTRQDPPLSFSNPMTEPGSTMMVPISQIDVRALELDPIVFEPLPTVHDLTPLSGKTHQGELRGSHSGQRRNPVIPISPFSADDSAVYAHDWFEEPHNNFPRRNIEYVKEIGKGWFGQVIEAEARDIVPFAKKIRVIVKLLREDANGIEQMRFLDESRMYRDGDHGNILKLMGHSIEKLPFLLIMEYCPQGDLKSFLISNVIRAEMLNNQGQIVKMALDVSKGLEWLHNAGFVHPDLAARNCQVGSENRVVIGDYGLGTQNFRDDYHWSSSVAIPLRWTAPETLHCTLSIIQILKVTETSNIWSLGVVMWEICEFGKLPYSELADDEVISRVIIDKNHTLGRPTMPCMSAKEELFRIMSSCWQPDLESRPRLFTIVRELEELHNAFVSSTRTNASNHLQASTPSNSDEFDSKWEQLAGRGNYTDDEKRRKKNVSFLDLEKQVGLKFDLPYPEKENKRVNSSAEEDVATNVNVTAEPQKELDSEEDEPQWTKKIERGDITQKVLEKSQSVQDLMVLTHFEQGDMGDLDSLPFVGKPFLQDHPPSNQSSAVSSSRVEDTGKESESAVNGGSNIGSSTLKKSCSEPAIDTLSVANSSQTLTPGSACDSTSSQATLVNVPQEDQSPFTPRYQHSFTVPPRLPVVPPRININLIPATPNPSVEVDAIHSTPSSNQSSSSTSTSQQLDESAPTNNVNRRLKFKFDSDSPSPPSSPSHSCSEGLKVAEFRQRLTSTPLRSGSTPSPRVSDFEEGVGDDGGDADENVFESSSGYYMEGTFSLSPISQSYVTLDDTLDKSGRAKKSRAVKGESIIFGPCDDHELGSYQGVKSQIHQVSQSQSDESEVCSVAFVTPQEESKLKVGIPRRVLFPNGDHSEESNDCEGKNKNKATSSLSSSAHEVDSTTSTGSFLFFEKSNGSAEERVSKPTSANVEADKKAEVQEDPDEFWKLQLRSLQMAADSTRELLFQTGLDEPVSSTSDNKRFVEDIEADVEELGSLVLHDLDEPESLQTIIKETREPLTSGAGGVNVAKLAFETSNATSTSSQIHNDVLDTGFIHSNPNMSEDDTPYATSAESTKWADMNNSIEIRKGKDLGSPLVFTKVKPLGENDIGRDGMGSREEDDDAEFVPSIWNQSLIPSRSAIKSPEQQTLPKTTGMKKSVSFEMNKSRLIYEYPPPPVVSDSEEEEHKAILLGSASLSGPLASSLDWELTQEELEDAEINHEDWEEDVLPKAGDPMDVYRISGFNDDNFQVRCSNEPFVFSPLAPLTPSPSSTLGELRHTRDRLRLDLSRGEASFLDEERLSSSNPAKLDSGVGSSTNVTPFNTDCDILTKRSKTSD